MKYIYVLIIVSFLFFSCNIEKRQNDLVFDTSKLDVDIAKKNGYEWLTGVDLIIFNKKIKDTLTSLVFDNTSKLVEQKKWKIKIKSNDIKSVTNFLTGEDAFQITTINYSEDKTSYSFAVKRNLDNNVFFCQVITENGIQYLSITYYVPR